MFIFLLIEHILVPAYTISKCIRQRVYRHDPSCILQVKQTHRTGNSICWWLETTYGFVISYSQIGVRLLDYLIALPYINDIIEFSNEVDTQIVHQLYKFKLAFRYNAWNIGKSTSHEKTSQWFSLWCLQSEII